MTNNIENNNTSQEKSDIDLNNFDYKNASNEDLKKAYIDDMIKLILGKIALVKANEGDINKLALEIKNVKEIREIKKDIARILTLLK